MANLHAQYSIFNENITLTSKKKKNLRKGRKALRSKIRQSFSDNNRKTPKFCGQGSYVMKTIINPLEGCEYDIDDGIYLQGYGDDDIIDWPTTSTVHSWIKTAVKGHTNSDPIDKNTCVRVVYAGDYHIDLPSYIMMDNTAYLSHKRDGWIESDPKAFNDWFALKLSDDSEQFRSLVKYVKAWKDYCKVNISGIIVTILVSNNFYAYTDRDDKAMYYTVQQILNTLNCEFKCKKPVSPYEDLFKDYSKNEKDSVLDELQYLKEHLGLAISESDQEKAAEHVIKKVGDRFPKPKKDDDGNSEGKKFKYTKRPGVIRNDGRSAK